MTERSTKPGVYKHIGIVDHNTRQPPILQWSGIAWQIWLSYDKEVQYGTKLLLDPVRGQVWKTTVDEDGAITSCVRIA